MSAARKVVELSTVRKQSLSESVYQQLKQKIVTHEIAAGEALPAERQLSEMLGVNRGAVREAIKRLQQAGLVAVRQGGNHVVLDYQEEGGLELLASLLVNRDGAVDPGVARAIMSLRASIAPEIAAAAAENGGRKLGGELDAILEAMRASKDDVARLQELAWQIWGHLVSAADNIAFRLAFNSMNRTYRSVWTLLSHVLEAEFRDFKNLEALVAAVRRRDPAAARKSAARHLALGTRAMDGALRGLATPRA